MDIIREPKGIDFAVEPVKLSKADKELISKSIAHYKATGDKLIINSPTKKSVMLTHDKELITKPKQWLPRTSRPIGTIRRVAKMLAEILNK
jgi:hypothetical protein